MRPPTSPPPPPFAVGDPLAAGLVCYRSVVAGTTDFEWVPVGALAWRRPLQLSPRPPALPLKLAAAAGVRMSDLPLGRLARPRSHAPCRLRVVLVVPVVARGRRPHHLENLYGLQDALEAAAAPPAPAASAAAAAAAPALLVASSPLAAVEKAVAAAAAPLDLTVTTLRREALNDSAVTFAAADLVIFPHDPAYAAAVGFLRPGAAVVELCPFGAAPPAPRRWRAARSGGRRGGGAPAGPGGVVSRRVWLVAAAAAAGGSLPPLAAAVGIAVTLVGGLRDGDAFGACLGASTAAATSRRAAVALLRRWRRAARRARRGGAGGGGAAGGTALPSAGGRGGRRVGRGGGAQSAPSRC